MPDITLGYTALQLGNLDNNYIGQDQIELDLISLDQEAKTRARILNERDQQINTIGRFYPGTKKSKYDRFVRPTVLDYENKNDIYAAKQSIPEKFVNGTILFLANTAATYIDNVVGTPVGLATGVLGAITEAANTKENESILGNAFNGLSLGYVKNPVTLAMLGLRDVSKEYFPIYRGSLKSLTVGEMLTDPNFWAEDMLVNAGFTVGSMLSMSTDIYAGTKLGKLTLRGGLRAEYNALKNGTNIDFEMSRIERARKWLQLSKLNDVANAVEKLELNLPKANILFSPGSKTSFWWTSFKSSQSEARMEAYNAYSEYILSLGSYLKLKRDLDIQKAYDNSNSQEELEKKISTIEQNYNNAYNSLKSNANIVAADVWLLNSIILTFSNALDLLFFIKPLSTSNGSGKLFIRTEDNINKLIKGTSKLDEIFTNGEINTSRFINNQTIEASKKELLRLRPTGSIGRITESEAQAIKNASRTARELMLLIVKDLGGEKLFDKLLKEVYAESKSGGKTVTEVLKSKSNTAAAIDDIFKSSGNIDFLFGEARTKKLALILGLVINPTKEGWEELAQAWASENAKLYYSDLSNALYNGKSNGRYSALNLLDPAGIVGLTMNILSPFLKITDNYDMIPMTAISNLTVWKNNWNEGFMGFMTGLIGNINPAGMYYKRQAKRNAKEAYDKAREINESIMKNDGISRELFETMYKPLVDWENNAKEQYENTKIKFTDYWSNAIVGKWNELNEYKSKIDELVTLATKLYQLATDTKSRKDYILNGLVANSRYKFALNVDNGSLQLLAALEELLAKCAKAYDLGIGEQFMEQVKSVFKDIEEVEGEDSNETIKKYLIENGVVKLKEPLQLQENELGELENQPELLNQPKLQSLPQELELAPSIFDNILAAGTENKIELCNEKLKEIRENIEKKYNDYVKLREDIDKKLYYSDITNQMKHQLASGIMKYRNSIKILDQLVKQTFDNEGTKYNIIKLANEFSNNQYDENRLDDREYVLTVINDLISLPKFVKELGYMRSLFMKRKFYAKELDVLKDRYEKENDEHEKEIILKNVDYVAELLLKTKEEFDNVMERRLHVMEFSYSLYEKYHLYRMAKLDFDNLFKEGLTEEEVNKSIEDVKGKSYFKYLLKKYNEKLEDKDKIKEEDIKTRAQLDLIVDSEEMQLMASKNIDIFDERGLLIRDKYEYDSEFDKKDKKGKVYRIGSKLSLISRERSGETMFNDKLLDNPNQLTFEILDIASLAYELKGTIALILDDPLMFVSDYKRSVEAVLKLNSNQFIDQFLSYIDITDYRLVYDLILNIDKTVLTDDNLYLTILNADKKALILANVLYRISLYMQKLSVNGKEEDVETGKLIVRKFMQLQSIVDKINDSFSGDELTDIKTIVLGYIEDITANDVIKLDDASKYGITSMFDIDDIYNRILEETGIDLRIKEEKETGDNLNPQLKAKNERIDKLNSLRSKLELIDRHVALLDKTEKEQEKLGISKYKSSPNTIYASEIGKYMQPEEKDNEIYGKTRMYGKGSLKKKVADGGEIDRINQEDFDELLGEDKRDESVYNNYVQEEVKVGDKDSDNGIADRTSKVEDNNGDNNPAPNQSGVSLNLGLAVSSYIKFAYEADKLAGKSGARILNENDKQEAIIAREIYLSSVDRGVILEVEKDLKNKGIKSGVVFIRPNMSGDGAFKTSLSSETKIDKNGGAINNTIFLAMQISDELYNSDTFKTEYNITGNLMVEIEGNKYIIVGVYNHNQNPNVHKAILNSLILQTKEDKNGYAILKTNGEGGEIVRSEITRKFSGRIANTGDVTVEVNNPDGTTKLEVKKQRIYRRAKLSDIHNGGLVISYVKTANNGVIIYGALGDVNVRQALELIERSKNDGAVYLIVKGNDGNLYRIAALLPRFDKAHVDAGLVPEKVNLIVLDAIKNMAKKLTSNDNRTRKLHDINEFRKKIARVLCLVIHTPEHGIKYNQIRVEEAGDNIVVSVFDRDEQISFNLKDLADKKISQQLVEDMLRDLIYSCSFRVALPEMTNKTPMNTRTLVEEGYILLDLVNQQGVNNTPLFFDTSFEFEDVVVTTTQVEGNTVYSFTNTHVLTELEKLENEKKNVDDKTKLNENQPQEIGKRVIIDSSIENLGYNLVYGFKPNSENFEESAKNPENKLFHNRLTDARPTVGGSNLYVEYNGESYISFFVMNNGRFMDRGNGMHVSVWRPLTPKEVEKILEFISDRISSMYDDMSKRDQSKNIGIYEDIAEYVDKVMHESDFTELEKALKELPISLNLEKDGKRYIVTGIKEEKGKVIIQLHNDTENREEELSYEDYINKLEYKKINKKEEDQELPSKRQDGLFRNNRWFRLLDLGNSNVRDGLFIEINGNIYEVGERDNTEEVYVSLWEKDEESGIYKEGYPKYQREILTCKLFATYINNDTPIISNKIYTYNNKTDNKILFYIVANGDKIVIESANGSKHILRDRLKDQDSKPITDELLESLLNELEEALKKDKTEAEKIEKELKDLFNILVDSKLKFDELKLKFNKIKSRYNNIASNQGITTSLAALEYNIVSVSLSNIDTLINILEKLTGFRKETLQESFKELEKLYSEELQKNISKIKNEEEIILNLEEVKAMLEKFEENKNPSFWSHSRLIYYRTYLDLLKNRLKELADNSNKYENMDLSLRLKAVANLLENDRVEIGTGRSKRGADGKMIRDEDVNEKEIKEKIKKAFNISDDLVNEAYETWANALMKAQAKTLFDDLIEEGTGKVIIRGIKSRLLETYTENDLLRYKFGEEEEIEEGEELTTKLIIEKITNYLMSSSLREKSQVLIKSSEEQVKGEIMDECIKNNLQQALKLLLNGKEKFDSDTEFKAGRNLRHLLRAMQKLKAILDLMDSILTVEELDGITISGISFTTNGLGELQTKDLIYEMLKCK